MILYCLQKLITPSVLVSNKSLNYNGLNSYLFVNGVEIYKFNAQVSEINDAAFCLGNISRNSSADNMKRLDYMDSSMNFQLIMIVLLQNMLWLFIKFNC